MPTFLFDFGLEAGALPSAGIYFFWDEAFAKPHDIRLRAAFGGEDWVEIDFTNRVHIGRCDLLELGPILGEGHVEPPLPRRRSVEKDLQAQRGLPRARAPLQEVDPAAGEASAEDLVEAANSGGSAFLGEHDCVSLLAAGRLRLVGCGHSSPAGVLANRLPGGDRFGG